MITPSEINSYGTHFYDIKTIVDNPQPCEIEITIIKAGSIDYNGFPIRFDYFEIETKETYPIIFPNGSKMYIPYAILELRQNILNDSFSLVIDRRDSYNFKTKEKAIEAAKTICYILTENTKKKISTRIINNE